jgi:predicted GIY-YIG superfamily endonuclease
VDEMPFFVYLLKSNNTPTCSATYIGFSTDPHRRLRQHNGEIAAGAMKTHKYRPWEHICVLSGFPSRIVALMFEWQWQHPKMSRILKDKIAGVKYQGKGAKGQLLLLKVLLQSSLWSQLELTVHFLHNDIREWFIGQVSGENVCAKNQVFRTDLVDPTEVGDMSQRGSPTKVAMSVALSFANNNNEDGINCDICKGSYSYRSNSESGFEPRMWSCPNCGAAAHILCSATLCSSPHGVSDAASALQRVLPAAFSCSSCHHSIGRATAARMSFVSSMLKSAAGNAAAGDVADALDDDVYRAEDEEDHSDGGEESESQMHDASTHGNSMDFLEWHDDYDMHSQSNEINVYANDENVLNLAQSG